MAKQRGAKAQRPCHTPPRTTVLTMVSSPEVRLETRSFPARAQMMVL